MRSCKQCRRHLNTKRLGGREVDQQLELGGLHDRQVGGLFDLEDAAEVNACLPGASVGQPPETC
jgi:hypothetical protein